jgi:hypothetical protein
MKLTKLDIRLMKIIKNKYPNTFNILYSHISAINSLPKQYKEKHFDEMREAFKELSA